jgi:prepilin-type N-terminal cleavage/methylation domain-containing protein
MHQQVHMSMSIKNCGALPDSRGYRRYRRYARQKGMTLIEISIVSILSLILAAMAIPSIVSAIRMAHLRGAASDYSGLLQQTRIYAVRDNAFYKTYILAPAGSSTVALAYVDLTKNGGTGVVNGDPTVTIESDVLQKTVGSAPNTNNLKTQLLPATTPVTPTDTSVTPATFGPRGLPCTPLTLSGTTSAVCDNSGGVTAFWTFLQNTQNASWQAVTITPAGRIQRWYYTGSAWSKL